MDKNWIDQFISELERTVVHITSGGEERCMARFFIFSLVSFQEKLLPSPSMASSLSTLLLPSGLSFSLYLCLCLSQTSSSWLVQTGTENLQLCPWYQALTCTKPELRILLITVMHYSNAMPEIWIPVPKLTPFMIFHFQDQVFRSDYGVEINANPQLRLRYVLVL